MDTSVSAPSSSDQQNSSPSPLKQKLVIPMVRLGKITCCTSGASSRSSPAPLNTGSSKLLILNAASWNPAKRQPPRIK
ncbi:hypothetical protein BS78_05G146200 [Paspalum vaginatum]|nr:hypothetical protein BS78_05G146200 [Paspalum vaginatum]